MRHQPTLKTDAMMAIIKVSEFFFLLEDTLRVVIHLGLVVRSRLEIRIISSYPFRASNR